MNERIKLLADEARKHFPKTEMSGEFWVFDEGKFAELIVRECVKLQYKNVGVSDYNRGRRELTEDIQKHFGVEE